MTEKDRFKPLLSPAEKRAILKARAQALAEPAEQAPLTQDCLALLEFQLAGERYAVETVYVREVVARREVVAVPCVPPHITGIFNVRGEILPMVDLRSILELDRSGTAAPGPVLVLWRDDMTFGVQADRIDGVTSLPKAELRPVPATFAGSAGDYLKGVTAAGLAVLDAGRMLTDSRLVVQYEERS